MGCTYTKSKYIIHAYSKFIFDWTSWILCGNPIYNLTLEAKLATEFVGPLILKIVRNLKSARADH